MAWTPPVTDDEGVDASVEEEAPVVARRAAKGRPVRRRRSRRSALVGHITSMGGMMVIAVLAFLAFALLWNYGPWAEPGPLTPQERATLAAKYEAIVAPVNDAEGQLNLALGQFASGITDLPKAKQLFGQYYDAEKQYLDGLAGVDWRGARKEARAVMDAVRDELSVLAQARDAATQAQADAAVSAWPAKRQVLDGAIDGLRNALGIPRVPAPLATEPVESPAPAAESPAVSASAGSPGASAGSSASPSDSASPVASPSGSTK